MLGGKPEEKTAGTADGVACTGMKGFEDALAARTHGGTLLQRKRA